MHTPRQCRVHVAFPTNARSPQHESEPPRSADRVHTQQEEVHAPPPKETSIRDLRLHARRTTREGGVNRIHKNKTRQRRPETRPNTCGGGTGDTTGSSELRDNSGPSQAEHAGNGGRHKNGAPKLQLQSGSARMLVCFTADPCTCFPRSNAIHMHTQCPRACVNTACNVTFSQIQMFRRRWWGRPQVQLWGAHIHNANGVNATTEVGGCRPAHRFKDLTCVTSH